MSTSAAKHPEWDLFINQGVTPHPEVEETKPKMSKAKKVGLALGVVTALATGVLLDGRLISLIATYMVGINVSFLQGVGARLLIQFFLPRRDS